MSYVCDDNEDCEDGYDEDIALCTAGQYSFPLQLISNKELSNIMIKSPRQNCKRKFVQFFLEALCRSSASVISGFQSLFRIF